MPSWIPAKDKLERILSKLGISNSKAYLDRIFGIKTGNFKINGLIDSLDEQDLEKAGLH